MPSFGTRTALRPVYTRSFTWPALKIGEPAAGTHLELAHLDRTAGVERGVGEEIDAIAERARDLRVGRPQAGREPLGADGDPALLGIVEVLRQAAEPERHVLRFDVGGLQPVEHQEAVPSAGLAVAHVEVRRLEPGPGPRHRQDHRRAGWIAERAGQRQVAQEAVAACLQAAVEGQRGAGNVQVVDLETAAGLVDARDLDGGPPREEVAKLRRDQRREPAVEVHVEAEALVARAQRHGALRDPVLVGVKAEVDVHLIERAGAAHLEVDGGLALDLEKRRHQAPLGLMQPDVDVEVAGGVGEGGLDVELAPRPVQALDAERAVERPIRRDPWHRLP